MRVIPVKQDWKPPIKLIKVKDGIHSIWDWTPVEWHILTAIFANSSLRKHSKSSDF